MKLSSISVIAAALAAITGGAIATPGLLHAPALEQVNSFEYGVNIYSRASQHQVDHRNTALDLKNSADVHYMAAIRADYASRAVNGEQHRSKWERTADRYMKTATKLMDKHRAHSQAAENPDVTRLHRHVNRDSSYAQTTHRKATETIELAKDAVILSGRRPRP